MKFENKKDKGVVWHTAHQALPPLKTFRWIEKKQQTNHCYSYNTLVNETDQKMKEKWKKKQKLED